MGGQRSCCRIDMEVGLIILFMFHNSLRIYGLYVIVKTIKQYHIKYPYS